MTTPSQILVVYKDGKEVEFNNYQLLGNKGFTAILNNNFMAYDSNFKEQACTQISATCIYQENRFFWGLYIKYFREQIYLDIVNKNRKFSVNICQKWKILDPIKELNTQILD